MATASPESAKLQEQLGKMKLRQAELEKTIQDLADENKVKVALQVKQIDERNKLEKHIDQLTAKMKDAADLNQKKVERLKREHSSEMEDLRSLFQNATSPLSPLASPHDDPLDSPSKRSSIYLKIGPPADHPTDKIKVTTHLKELQHKVLQLEQEKADLKASLSQMQVTLESQLHEVQGDNTRLKADLKQRTEALEEESKRRVETLKAEQESYLKELKERSIEKPKEEAASPNDEIHAEVSAQLAAANEKISGLELSNEELKLMNNDLKSELENSKESLNEQVTTIESENSRLQKKCDDLTRSERWLKEECEQLKNDYNLSINSQNVSMTDMKELVKSLKQNESELRNQMDQTHKDYESKLDKTSEGYDFGISRLQESLQMQQTELLTVLEELEAARKETVVLSDRYNAQLDQKAEDMEKMFDKYQELQIELEKVQIEYEEKKTTFRKDIDDKSGEIKKMKLDLGEKIGALESAEQRVAELEENLTVWKSAAADKEGSESVLTRKLTELESQSKLQREQLQEKINFLTKQVTEQDHSSTDGLRRMEILEQTIQEKDQALVKYESQVAELIHELEKQRDHYEATLGDLDQVLKKNMDKTQKLEEDLKEVKATSQSEKEEAIKEAEKRVEEKSSEMSAVSSKVSDVRAESNDRIKDMKTRNEELGDRLAEKEKQLIEKDTEMKHRLHEMMMEFEDERQMLILDTQATAKVLNERLDKEREAMNAFKANVTKQFDERQEQVKEMMGQMKARFTESIQEKEEIFNRRVQKAEKAKEREKNLALKDREVKFNEQFSAFKETQENNFKLALEETKSKYEEELNSLRTKYGEPVKDKDTVIAAAKVPTSDN